MREEKFNIRTRPMTVGPEVDVRAISVSFLGHFLINNPLFLLTSWGKDHSTLPESHHVQVLRMLSKTLFPLIVVT